ncbi:peptidyl-prolyl cis-trans isomerase FKBP4-like [Saccoglossus kowalevskii]
MKIGEVCVLTCKPEYAYGKTAQRRIPANSTLVFEVELFSFQGDDLTINKDKGILRRIVQAGEGVDTPNEDANVDVHLTGIYEDRIFEDRDVQFVIGEAIDQGIPSGVEEAIQKMKKGEKVDLDLSSKYAFGSVGKAEFSIPPNVNVRYQVDLKDFEKAKESWEMDLDEKMKSSEVIKAKGTEYFKSGNYLKAIKQYKKIVDYLSSERETEMPPETQKECDKLVLAANLNLAMCYLKIGEEVQAVDVCDKALQIDNKNEKGYFRRGSARLIQNELQLAAEDFQTVLELEPNNKAAKNQLILVCKKMKLQKEQERKTYGNMFTRFAEQDAKAEAKKKTEIIKKPDTKPDETENVNEDLEMEDESPETNENTV